MWSEETAHSSWRLFNIKWTPYFHELKLHSAAAGSLWVLRQRCIWNADTFSCKEKHWCNQRLGKMLLSLSYSHMVGWRGVGSSYPVSKPRPVSPWTSRRSQTQHRWSMQLDQKPDYTVSFQKVQYAHPFSNRNMITAINVLASWRALTFMRSWSLLNII